MQLILLLLLLFSGSSDIKNFAPLLGGMTGEGDGGGLSGVIEQAEQIARIASAFSPDTGAATPAEEVAAPVGQSAESQDNHPFPLAPVSSIADEPIASCLSRYISLGN